MVILPVVVGCALRGRLPWSPGMLLEFIFDIRPHRDVVRWLTSRIASPIPLSKCGRLQQNRSKRGTGGFQKEGLAPRWRPRRTPGNRQSRKRTRLPLTRDGFFWLRSSGSIAKGPGMGRREVTDVPVKRLFCARRSCAISAAVDWHGVRIPLSMAVSLREPTSKASSWRLVCVKRGRLYIRSGQFESVCACLRACFPGAHLTPPPWLRRRSWHSATGGSDISPRTERLKSWLRSRLMLVPSEFELE
jgi:hypothetical protein